MTKEEFLKSIVSQDIAKWNFYVVVQGCLDLGNHIISIKRFEMPERYEDILSILERNDIISDELVVSLEGMGNFRNLIAHGYFKVDLERLWLYLKKIDKIKEFIEILKSYLKD